MEVAPWVVSVLSTSYDLEEERKAIIKELENNGIVVSAFEEPEFPAEYDVHSHDSCLIALQRADIALLIINKRYGGRYYQSEGEESDQSITEKEFLTAIEKGIPIFTFVHEKAWDERHSYKKQLKKYINKESRGSSSPDELKDRFDDEYTCTYVEKVSTLDFIEAVQKAFDEHHVSNWIDRFDSIDSLIEKVRGKLKGYSRRIVENISVAQRDALLKKHTSTAFGMTLGDVFKSQYYIQPPYVVESGELIEKDDNFTENLIETICNEKSVLIYGEAGYGKTTILAKCFTDHLQKCLSHGSYSIPLFVSLRNKGFDYHFDFMKFIDEELQNAEYAQRRHVPYPYLDLTSIKPYFYCDGFDEMAEKLDSKDLDRISHTTIFGNPILLTCRQQYANRYLRNYAFSDHFNARIRIKKWSSDIAHKYIINYFEKITIDDKTKSIIYESIKKSDLQQVLDSPLLITMFLWYVDKEKKTIEDITTTALFENWIIELARREHSKLNEDAIKINDNDIVAVWGFAAWSLYRKKLSESSQLLRLDDLIASLVKEFPEQSGWINPPLFESLFDCTNDKIIGTFHEQFMEYLVARVLINSCIKKVDPYPDFLKMVMRPEINRHFRGIWNQCNNRDREMVFGALYDIYSQHVGEETQDAILSRVHAIYHISRLNSPQREKCLEKAFNSEKHISVLLSLYFGTIKMGNLEKEEEFYNLLITDQDYNEANRGYHLAYYSDSIVKDDLPFKDNTDLMWNGTLRAFLRHFSSNNISHYYLRRIDLVTMRQLIEARKIVEPLSEEILKSLEKIIESFDTKNNNQFEIYNEKIKTEFKELVDVYNKYNR